MGRVLGSVGRRDLRVVRKAVSRRASISENGKRLVGNDMAAKRNGNLPAGEMEVGAGSGVKGSCGWEVDDCVPSSSCTLCILCTNSSFPAIGDVAPDWT